MRRAAILIAALAAAVAVPAGAAARPDSDAPPGATGDWLPQEAWVMERWLPYDEARLERVLKASPAQLRGWLRTNRRNLLGLARERRVPTARLAERLVGPRPAGVSRAAYAQRISRARRTLTQSHLLLHILRHDFHQWSLLRATPRVFGVATIGQWRRMRLRGMSPLEIGARLGRDDGAAIRRDLVKVIERSANRGVSAGATSRAQAGRFVAQQRRTLERWLRSPLVRPPTEPSAARAMGRSALCHI